MNAGLWFSLTHPTHRELPPTERPKRLRAYTRRSLQNPNRRHAAHQSLLRSDVSHPAHELTGKAHSSVSLSSKEGLSSIMSSSADNPLKARLAGNTPSLSDRIAALQRRNVSGPAASSTSASASTPTAAPGSTGSSSTSPPGSQLGTSAGGGASSSASSAVKDRIARLQSKGDGESPLLPRSSFGAPAPNPEVASHALRQFPGASLGPAQGTTLRPQMTGGAWLNGVPATSGGLRPQMTGGMWGNQYYGAGAAVPMPRRGVSPSTPTRKQTDPVILGGSNDAFAELDREAELARTREGLSGSGDSNLSAFETLTETNELPSLPSAPEVSPPSPPSSPPRSPAPDSAAAAPTLPDLPEVPTEAPQFRVDPSPDARPPSPTAANGQSREIEIGMRAPEDPEAQRKLEQLVSATGNIHVQTTTPPSPTGSSVANNSLEQRKNNPLYRDITDDDDQLSPADQYGTLTVIRRSRAGSSVSDGLHGVGQAAVDSLLEGSDDEDSNERPVRSNSKRNAISGLPKRSSSPPLRASSRQQQEAEDGQNGTTTSQLERADINGSPARASSSVSRTESPSLQSPRANGANGTEDFRISPSPSSNFSLRRLTASGSTESGLTITSNPRTIHDSPTRVSELRSRPSPSASSSSMATVTTPDRTQSPSVPRRSASVASSNYSSGASGGRRSTTVNPVDSPIFEGDDGPSSIAESGSTSASGSAAPSSAGEHTHGRRGSERQGSVSGASSGAHSGTSPSAAAAARAREAIALARSKSQGGRLARPPPPGRTLTAAELDASDDDYEPGWASIISRK
ncbi:unnamed protein product [Tilletia laevis]|uniref:Uncharacterized protein n=2 Tax=Tilletia TaxID=13289 RepID=A0A177V8L3_9BASI|nr:hypothetical protein CF336_g4745 [Tilletia laevis]KAE8252988.1 hypothetical protein A4X03_0g6016 [Tilletia caries]KAE8200618.1 hypothetical protein CF335_g3922 [Tilletia laevis]CAD6915761.1 unnamed protein product [Tilletia laevis]CAD6954997.1 unnamed protein product [Tilletia caries]